MTAMSLSERVVVVGAKQSCMKISLSLETTLRNDSTQSSLAVAVAAGHADTTLDLLRHAH